VRNPLNDPNPRFATLVIVRDTRPRDLETIFDYIATDSVLAARRTTLELLYSTVRVAVFPRLSL